MEHIARLIKSRFDVIRTYNDPGSPNLIYYLNTAPSSPPKQWLIVTAIEHRPTLPLHKLPTAISTNTFILEWKVFLGVIWINVFSFQIYNRLILKLYGLTNTILDASWLVYCLGEYFWKILKIAVSQFNKYALIWTPQVQSVKSF